MWRRHTNDEMYIKEAGWAATNDDKWLDLTSYSKIVDGKFEVKPCGLRLQKVRKDGKKRCKERHLDGGCAGFAGCAKVQR